ncbi:hypothetical protein V8C37DRAFT_392503 [Trichoderma ceciliae]
MLRYVRSSKYLFFLLFFFPLPSSFLHTRTYKVQVLVEQLFFSPLLAPLLAMRRPHPEFDDVDVLMVFTAFPSSFFFSFFSFQESTYCLGW